MYLTQRIIRFQDEQKIIEIQSPIFNQLKSQILKQHDFEVTLNDEMNESKFMNQNTL